MNENENKEQTTLVDLTGKVKGKIDLPKFDLSKYIGKKTTIDKVETHKGKFGYFIKVFTKVIDTLTFNGEEKPLQATKIFGLQEDENKNIGWGDGTNLDIFLKSKKVDHFEKLVGQEVIIQKRMGKEDEKEYLDFV